MASGGMAAKATVSNGVNLTEHESQIAGLVAAGLRNAEIALRLGISESAVSDYLLGIYAKLRIFSRVELVLYMIEQSQRARYRVRASAPDRQYPTT